MQTTVPTYTATIYVGFLERDTGHVHTLEEAEEVCRDYCNMMGLCVTVTLTSFIYTGGGEPGCMVGLIHYPRFPQEQPAESIRSRALTLAGLLRKRLRQELVSVVFPDCTMMLSDSDEVPNDAQSIAFSPR